jgi:hypothetical protein
MNVYSGSAIPAFRRHVTAKWVFVVFRESIVLAAVNVSPVLNFLPNAVFFRNLTPRLARDYFITK